MSTKKVYFGPIPKKHIEMSNIENNCGPGLIYFFHMSITTIQGAL